MNVNNTKKVPYIDTLDNVTRVRYLEKLNLINNKDPYDVKRTEWSSNVEDWPEVMYPDIVNYLVFQQSAYTLEDLKAYKSLDAYNQFVCGWVKDVGSLVFGDKYLVSGKVRHSQRMNETPLQPWLISKKNGTVLAGHCNCMAGLGETCSHVGALLFYLEAAIKAKKSQTVTDVKSYWLPASVQKIEPKRIQEIDFSSAKTKKKRLDDVLETGVFKSPVRPKYKDVPEPSTDEMKSVFQALHTSGSKSAILSLIPDYNVHYIPKTLDSKYPKILSELKDDNFTCANIDKATLLAHCTKLFDSVKVSEEEAKNVEEATRDQSSCKEWYRFRTGRVTASKCKNVCGTSVDNPSLSLVKSICYPATSSFKSKATAWGCTHEKDAKSQYIQHMQNSHDNFAVKDSGFIINPQYPFLGASPDGIATCNCCGDICVEIKCPYCKRDKTLQENLSDGCLENVNGTLRLKRNHQYFYQVQCQLLVSEMEYCDFIVWTNVDFHYERISIDMDLTKKIVEKARNFFTNAILPELVGKFFSRPVVDKTSTNRGTSGLTELSNNVDCPSRSNDSESESDLIICTCQTKYNPESDNVIGCDNENCPYMWLHFECVNIKRAPKGNWYCPECRKDSEFRPAGKKINL